MKNEKQKEIKYFSMFSGVGGFELGIGERGKCIGQSEIDKYASELLKQKWPSIKNYGDATKIISEELPDFNLLVGGFPCQAFSIAGKRRGFEDTRGTLFYDIARILKIKRPEYILLENVKGLLSHDRGRTFGTIIATLSELGYVVQWMVLNSKFFGVPQNRERIFIIGSLRGKPIPEILPLGENDKNDNQESRRKSLIQTKVSGTVTTKFGDRYQDTFINVINNPRGQGFEMTQVHNMQPRSPNRPSLKYSSGGSGHLQRDDIAYCLDGGNTNAIEFNTMKIRRLTPTECERLQGFPDGWTEGFSDTQRYKMMGNAVTVNVIKAVIGEMFK
jgi:DNA (cytosine-5)-methyltransferase 1